MKSKFGLRIRMIVASLAFMFVMIGVAVALGAYIGYMWAFIAIAIVMNGLMFWFGPKIAMRTMRAEKVSRSERPKLHDAVERTAREAGIPKPDVAVSSMGVPNAFATGRSKSNSVVCVTEPLMMELNDDELEAVIAHEVTHIDNRDMLVMTLASTIGAIMFYITHFTLFDGENGIGAIAAIVASIAAWVITILVQQAISRYREFLADRGAVEITGNPAAMKNALNTIDKNMDMYKTKNKDDAKTISESGSSALMISAVSEGILSNLLSSHPSTEKRVEAIEEYAEKNNIRSPVPKY